MLYIEFLYDIYKLCSSLSDLCELGFCCSLKNILLIRSIVHVCSSLLINLLSIPLYILFLPPPTLSPLHIHSQIIDTSICVYTYLILFPSVLSRLWAHTTSVVPLFISYSSPSSQISNQQYIHP